MQTTKSKNAVTNNSSSLFPSNSGDELKFKNDLMEAELLHRMLQVETPVRKWIRRKIKDYGFSINFDFFTTDKIVRGQKKTEYHLTGDMAKELSMLEKNEIGRNIRKRLIEIEKDSRAKRLYASIANVTDISKIAKPISINNRKMYELSKVRRALGYNAHSSTSHIHKTYPGLVVVIGRKAWIAEDYVRVMMINAKSRSVRAEAIQAQPVLALDFGTVTKTKGGLHA